MTTNLTTHEYGAIVTKAMSRISEIGVNAWLAEEMQSPSSDDPQWCRVVIDITSKRAEKTKVDGKVLSSGG